MPSGNWRRRRVAVGPATGGGPRRNTVELATVEAGQRNPVSLVTPLAGIEPAGWSGGSGSGRVALGAAGSFDGVAPAALVIAIGGDPVGVFVFEAVVPAAAGGKQIDV